MTCLPRLKRLLISHSYKYHLVNLQKYKADTKTQKRGEKQSKHTNELGVSLGLELRRTYSDRINLMQINRKQQIQV